MRRLLVFMVCLGALLASNVYAGEKVTVAAGAGYKQMVKELATAFTEKTGIVVEQIYGNMGQTIAQAKNSGMVDCIVGDKSFLDKSRLVFSGMHEIGRGALVAVYAKGLAIKEPADILRKDVARVAMPDPKKAIYGRAADEYLHNSGLYDKVQSKLLVVATVPQASAYVLSKEVDVGFINLTDALSIRDKVGGVLPVDRRYYSPIVIVAADLASAPNANALKNFAEFLASDQARAIAEKHGL